MSNSKDWRVRVEVLADEYLQRRKAGDRVTIEQYVDLHPDLADDILDVFPAMEAMQNLSASWKQAVSNHRSGPKLPFQLGDYLLEREIGRGGMGIVYEAQHASLRRQVAIKLLTPLSLNSDKDLQRFHREARAAASLHHTNIVPVFDFGEQQGFYFIAMQLIRGTGLDALVSRARADFVAEAETPRDLSKAMVVSAADAHHEACTKAAGASVAAMEVPPYNSDAYWKTVASFGIQAANALQYAHLQGTVHRDIKPANLLLDAGGIVWIADFGLARQATDELATQSGMLSGTLRYLAPEHFQGTCDERTDQYGLGLSLYELITLQPAMGDTGSHAEIMKRIVAANVVLPRRINGLIPRDLETIILKSMAANPTLRFASCQMLAEELTRFVEGRPIHSRPVSSFERIWRWSKRNPLLASSSALSALLLAMVAIVALVGYRAERHQREVAESTSDLLLNALDSVFDEYALPQKSSELLGTASLPTPVLTKDSAAMLEKLLPIFDRLAAIDDNSDVRLRAVAAGKRVGDIHQRLGQFSDAVAAYRKAATGFLSSPNADSVEVQTIVSDTYNEIGICELMLGQTAASKASHLAALESLQRMQVSNANPELEFRLAQTHYLLARELRPGESPTMQDMIPPSDEFENPRPAPGPHPFGPPRPFREPGGRWPNGPPPPNGRPEGGRPEGGPPLGGPPRRGGDDLWISPQNREHLEAAIALLEPLNAGNDVKPRCRHLLASCLRGLVSDRFSHKSIAEAEADNRALSMLKSLVADYPDVPEFRLSLADSLAAINTQGRDAIHPEDLRDAEQRLREALEVAELLVADHPYVPEYAVALIHVRNRLAHILERRSERLAACPDTRFPLDIIDEMVYQVFC